MNRKDTLDAAAACVLTDRQRTHGPIENSFGLIASLWSAYLSVTVTPFDVAEMMTLLKIARGKGNPLNPDNQVDGAGYQACAAELAEAMASPAPYKPIRYKAGVPEGMAVVRGPDVHSDLVGELLATRVAASTPSDAPAAPQTPPEGDHSQTDAGAQGDAIPDDCDGMWHNPENYPLTPDDMAEGWRFLTKDETNLPHDATFRHEPHGKKRRWRGVLQRSAVITYFTQTPLPQSPAKPIPDDCDDTWHNPERLALTADELADGWRFLTKGETTRPESTEFYQDSIYDDEGGHWTPVMNLGNQGVNPQCTYRTRAPLPHPPSKAIDATPALPEGWWHNPDNVVLTDEDKTKGWRFLYVGEPSTPDDTQVIDDYGIWRKLPADFKGPCGTCRTRAPLPLALYDNLHQTTP